MTKVMRAVIMARPWYRGLTKMMMDSRGVAKMERMEVEES